MNPGAPASLRYTLHPAAEHDLEDASRHYRRAVMVVWSHAFSMNLTG